MNKRYKVVWSKAKNCYVVVSEFAKSHQTGTKRVKSTAAAVGMAACLLTSGGVAFATTGGPTVDTDNNYVWSNGGTGTGAQDNVVVGPGSKVNDSKKSIAVGKNATTQDKAEDAIAIGTDATASGTSTVAIGTGASAANANSSAYGHNAKASNGSTAIGANADAANSVVGTIVISADDETKNHSNATSTGNRGITIGVGGKSNGDDSIAIGTDANANGALNVAIGVGAKVNGDQHKGGVALGAYSEVSEMKDPGHAGTTNGYEPGTGYYQNGSGTPYWDPIMDKAMTWDGSQNKMVYGDNQYANSVWNATNGAVSVGRLDLNDPSKTITRQITNVAAGTWLTDAVNVAQLKALEAKMTETGNIKSDLHLINGTETISGDEGQSNAIKGYKVDENGKLTLKVEDVTGTEEGYDVNIDLSALKNSGGWTAQANGKDVTPKDGKINFKNGDNISVTSNEGEITIAATGLADINLSNITNEGKTTITNLAKAADIHVQEGSYAVDENGNVTMKYVDGNGNLIEEKSLTITGLTSTNANNAAVVYVDNDMTQSLHSTNSGNIGTGSIALGKKANAVDNSIAIGDGAAVTKKGGVALGVGSVANTDKGQVGYLAADADTGATWKATGAALSVGSKEITRQITNVAAGTKDTDAVNVAQLTRVNDKANTAIETASKGWNVSTNGGTGTKVVPGDTVDFAGDTNISVSNTDKNISVKLNKDLKGLNSVTTNNAYVTNVDASKNESVTNVKYVQDQIADATLKEGNGISIADKKINVKLKDGEQNLAVDENGLSLKNDITLGDTGSDTSVAINGSKGTINASQSISAGNIIMDGNAGDITNLTNKTLDSKDFAKSGRAATEEQLQLVKDSITNDIGNATFGLADDNGNKVTKKLGDTVQVKGTHGITSTVKDGALEIGLGNDLTVGKDGKDGAAGSIGLVGPAGKDGKDGLTTTVIKTEYGSAGVDGKDGITRVVYETKDGVKHEVATLDDGLKFQGDRGDVIAKKLNETLNIKGNAAATAELSDGNIGITNENGDLVVKLNKDLKGIETIENGPSKVVLNEGYAGMTYGNTNVVLTDDGVYLNGKVNVDKAGKIHNVTAGTADEDAVNVSQLKKQTATSKTTVSDGTNTTVTSTVAEDGHTDYKVNLNKELEGIESISNGDNKINLNDNGIVISKGNDKVFSITDAGMGMSVIGDDYVTRSIMVSKNGTVISGGLSVAGSKITNVAAGTEDTDAVNYRQLKQAVSEGNTDTHIKAGEYSVGQDNTVSMDVVDKNGQSTGETVTIKDVAKARDVGDVSKIADDIKNKDGKTTTVVDAVNNVNNKVGDLNYSKVEKGDINDGDNTTTAIGKLNQKLSDVEQTAGKHSSVSTDDSNLKITEGTNDAGGKDYNVSLNKDLTLDSVTTGDTKMDTNGITIGDKVSLTKDGLTAGDTKVTNDGLSIGDKTYVSKDGLNANNQTITNVADGKVEKGSTDAVNGGQLYETNQAVINNSNNISSLSHSLSNLDNRVNKVGAGAAALAALHPLDFDPDAKWDFAAGYGNYRGTNAAAVGAYYRPNEDTMFSVGGTFGNGENMVNAGVSFKLGAGSSHVSTSRVAMAKEIKELRAHMAAQDKLIAQLTGPVNALTGSHIQADLNTLFPDVPKNHWAYDYVTKLAQAGYIEGYPDGNFKGDAMMTRYEFAAIIYRAMMNGAARDAKLSGDENLNKLLKEFEPELEYIRIDTIAKDKAGNPTIQRVRTVKANKNK